MDLFQATAMQGKDGDRMNKAFEKILERLSNIHRVVKTDEDTEWNRAIYKSTEIVQEVAEEYKGGWIACSEKLPELRQDVLVTVKYTGFMGMHGYWIKTGHMEAENDWWGDCAGGEVIAWQPLPKPFQKGDNNENS